MRPHTTSVLILLYVFLSRVYCYTYVLILLAPSYMLYVRPHTTSIRILLYVLSYCCTLVDFALLYRRMLVYSSMRTRS